MKWKSLIAMVLVNIIIKMFLIDLLFKIKVDIPENTSLGVLANEMGISKSTLSTWKKKVENTKGNIKSKRSLTPNDKFLIVTQTSHI